MHLYWPADVVADGFGLQKQRINDPGCASGAPPSWPRADHSPGAAMSLNKGGPKAALSHPLDEPPRRSRGSGPPVQPNKASSTDERLPDLRAIIAATTLQSLATESLLASRARRSFSVGFAAKIGRERCRFGGNREPHFMWTLVMRHLGNSCSTPPFLV
jgi:hypothetical protein